jgi:hypothetical protein
VRTFALHQNLHEINIYLIYPVCTHQCTMNLKWQAKKHGSCSIQDNITRGWIDSIQIAKSDHNHSSAKYGSYISKCSEKNCAVAVRGTLVVKPPCTKWKKGHISKKI